MLKEISFEFNKSKYVLNHLFLTMQLENRGENKY